MTGLRTPGDLSVRQDEPHVRYRRDPRPGRPPPRAPASAWRGAAPPRPRRRGRRADRPGHAGPHAPGDHRRRPAASSRWAPRTARSPRSSTARSTTSSSCAPSSSSAGHAFATHSDSEVVVHGYEEHGPDFVRRLNGIFAFALCDERRERLLAVRDPFGVKPLYWRSDGRRMALASEVGALIAAGLVTPAARPGGARPLPGLPLRARAAHPVRGGHEAARGEHAGGRARPAPKVESYREAPGADAATWSGDELEGELAGRFTDAVERQMMSDVPYGAFLSGGVDSAAIVAAMARRSRAAAHRPSRSASPATATCSTSAATRPRPPRRSAPTTTRPRWPRATSSASSSAACGGWRSRSACPPPAR